MQTQKGVASVILIVVIIVLLAVAGFFAYQYFLTKTNNQPQVQNQQQNQNQQQQTVNQQTNNAQPIDQTAGWKTYTNTQYGFSFKYPTSWESPFKGWSGWTAGESIDNNNYCVIDSSASKSSNQGEISDLLGKGYLQTPIKIGGIDGIRLTDNPSKAGLTEAVYFTYEGNNFRIGRNRGVGDKIENECINVFDQTLSTFKFTPVK